MHALETLRAAIPDAAKDLRLNLGAVLQPGTLTPAQTWGVAVATAIASRNPQLRQAVLEDALVTVPPEVVEDAKAAAALMGMNNVYYRFRHFIGKPEYGEKPARLRMQRLAQVATNKADFELFCLAVSTINGCEMCVRSHEEAVLAGGLTPDHVQDAVRIASTMHGVAVALEM
jgi:alkyl hydroperoxide reductase subunit D